MIKINILDCGSTFVDEALPLSNRSRNHLAFTGIGRTRRHQIEVPVTSYLIEHPEALILVDTGWDTAIRQDARKYEGFINYHAQQSSKTKAAGAVHTDMYDRNHPCRIFLQCIPVFVYIVNNFIRR